tara:strand:+ start:1402 stop:1842 length:441 start_codon:yes stop_codon:yes gene_type:complete
MALPVTDQLITQMMTENVRTQPTIPMEGNVSRPMIVNDLLKAMRDVNFSQLMDEYGSMAGQSKSETKPLTTGLMQQEGPKVPETPLEEIQPTEQQTQQVEQEEIAVPTPMSDAMAMNTMAPTGVIEQSQQTEEPMGLMSNATQQIA